VISKCSQNLPVDKLRVPPTRLLCRYDWAVAASAEAPSRGVVFPPLFSSPSKLGFEWRSEGDLVAKFVEKFGKGGGLYKLNADELYKLNARRRVVQVGTQQLTLRLKAPGFKPRTCVMRYRGFKPWLSNGSTCTATPRGTHDGGALHVESS
jgi:hypothetical protein